MSMYIVTHKEIFERIPVGYQPLLVGAEINGKKKEYINDNEGLSISEKNKNYCELTGLYWIWKNSSEKNVGISHYRRYFSEKLENKAYKHIQVLLGTLKPISLWKLDKYLEDFDIIVPKKECYTISVEKQYAQCHNIVDLNETKKIINNLTPEYLEAFNKVMKGHCMSMYNMVYTRKELFDDYCEWLFKILFELEKNIDISDYNNYQARVFGFISERLFNVWLEKNSELTIKYIDVYNIAELNRKNTLIKFTHLVNSKRR